MKIKKNDQILIMAGKDKGKSGRVFRVSPDKGRALVEGINYIKKHLNNFLIKQEDN